MNHAIELAICFLLGILSAATYFAGLWWTVQSFRHGENVVARYLVSFALRISLLCLVFGLVLQLGPVQLVCAFSGFLMFRWFAIGRWGRTGRLNSGVMD